MSDVSRRGFLVASGVACVSAAVRESDVETVQVPQAGLQPQAAVDAQGTLHLIYLYGDPAAADIGYVRRGPRDKNFSPPVRVNSQLGSAIALGTVRGAQLAVGRNGQIHVAWNGSSTALPKGPRASAPMLYARFDPLRRSFEEQRNVMTTAGGLDGGGTVAADADGNVYVAWHAQGQQDGVALPGEGHRRVWLAASTDDGATFGAERPVSPADTGACGCCGMGSVIDTAGHLYLVYRSARETVHRDEYVLTSQDHGKTFQAFNAHKWEIGACPMSTVSLVSSRARVFVAWETAKQVYFAPLAGTRQLGPSLAAPGEGENRKHPAIAQARDGRILLAWTEETGWKKGGSVVWQMFDERMQPIGEKGYRPGLPPWNFAAAVAVGNRFVLFS